MLRDSIEDPQPLDDELWKTFTSTPTFSPEDFYDLPDDLFIYNTDPQESDAFYESLVDWSRKWRLNAEWCRSRMHRVMVRQLFFGSLGDHLAAFETGMNDWQRSWVKRFDIFMGSLKERGFDMPGPDLYAAWKVEWLNQWIVKVGQDGPEVKPPHGYPLWDPEVELKDEYLDIVKREVQKEIECNHLLANSEPASRTPLIESIVKTAYGYCTSLEQLDHSIKWKQVETNAKLLTYLIWTARLQLEENLGFNEVAKQSNPSVDKSTVSREVRRILRLIDLKGEVGKRPGRHPNKKDAPDAPRQTGKRPKKRPITPEA